MKYLYSRDFFDRYRDLSADSQKPVKYEDCAKMYRECAAASGYNKDDTEVTDDDEKDDEVETITDADEEETTDEVTTDSNDIMTGRRAAASSSRLTQIIFNRSE